ncbi:MAG TPA: hypothetical protein VK116_12840, partial [Planctomycetota bacterium]|nr:hypothetical protein [Planctomycetota bacterium]
MRLEQLRSSFEGGTLGAAVRLSILPTVLLVTLASLIAIGGCSQPEEVASDEPRAIGGAEGPSPDFDGEHDASTLLSSEDDAAGGAGWFADDAETGEPRAEQPVEATDEILASALAESESPAVGIDASIDADARDGEDVVAAERSTETSSDDVTLAGESEIAARSDSESPAGDADATAARRERAATFLARLRNDLPPAGLDVGAAAGEPASTARSRSAKDASKNAVNGAGARDARSFLDDLRQGEEARSATEANAPSGERPVELAQASPAPGGSGREAIDLLLEELEARHGKGQTPEPAPVYRGGDPQEAPPAVEPPPLTFEHEIPSPLPEASASGEAAPVASAFERAGQHSHIVEL